MKKILIFIVLAIVLVFTGWRKLKSGQRQPRYQTAKVERGTIVSSMSVSGQIISANIINVTTQASGIVKKVFVQDGQVVKTGQKIVEITLDRSGQQQNASAWSNYLSAKNSLESAKTTLYTLNSSMWAANQKFINDAVARNLPTNDPTYIQQSSDWLAAEAKYKNQQNVIAQAQIALNNAYLAYQQSSPVVTSPATGTIIGLAVIEGMSLSGESQKVAVIQNQANPLATFNLSEIDLPKVKVGQKAIITLDSLADKTFTGKVSAIDRTGSVTSGVTNYPLIISFDTSTPEILPNMAASANIIIESKNDVLLVPSGAIQNINGTTVARVLKNGKEQQVLVETGLTSESQTEIVSGLAEGDEVISGTVSDQAQQFGTSPFGGFGARGGQMFIRR